MTGYTLALAFVAVTFVLMFALLRAGAVKEKYAVTWVVLGVVVVVLAAIPGLLPALTQLLGFQVPSNLLFFGAILLLFVVAVQTSVALSAHEEKLRTLAEEVAILRARLEETASEHEPPPEG